MIINSRTILRQKGETTEDHTLRIQGLRHQQNLMDFLWKLKIKSAKTPGLRIYSAFINTRIPGAY